MWVGHQGGHPDPGLLGDADQGRARSVWSMCIAAIVARWLGGVPQFAFWIGIRCHDSCPEVASMLQAPQRGSSLHVVSRKALAYVNSPPPAYESSVGLYYYRATTVVRLLLFSVAIARVYGATR